MAISFVLFTWNATFDDFYIMNHDIGPFKTEKIKTRHISGEHDCTFIVKTVLFILTRTLVILLTYRNI